MSVFPKNPRILLSNDDGIHAPGLKVLEKIARTLSDDIWVVAPENEQSGAAHSLTLSRPLRLRQMDEKRFAVNGTPTDCVMLAINKVMEKHRPDLVLSGVNHGSNLGEDVTYSGTVAAAMEATLLGIPSIAMSQETSEHGADDNMFARSAAEIHAPKIIQQLMQTGWAAQVLININFPAVKPEDVVGTRVVKQGIRTIRDNILKGKDPRGKTYYWIGSIRDDSPTETDTDLEAIMHKAISVTPLHLNLTHEAALENLRLALL